MKEGYLTLYTSLGGMKQFIEGGVCQAKLKIEGTDCYEIMVPRDSVINHDIDNYKVVVNLNIK